MIHNSKIPYGSALTGESMYHVIFQNNKNVPLDKPILIDIEPPYKVLTFEQLRKQILISAGGFNREFDLKRNDVVAICSPNHIDYISVIYGAVCAGGIVAPLHHFSPDKDIAIDLETVQAKFLITHIDVLDKVLTAAKIAGIDESNIVLFGDISVQGIRTVDDTILQGNQEAEPLRYTSDEMENNAALLYFTSGTTGRKKAVVRTQNNLLYNIKVVSADPRYTVINYMDFSHSSSLVAVMLISPYRGCTNYLLNHYKFSDLCAGIEKYKPLYMACPPYVLSCLIKDSITKEYDISSLKLLGCSGAVLKSTLIKEAQEKLGISVLNMYGMTEVLGVFTTSLAISAAGGVGCLNSGFSARIIDENGDDVLDDQTGELLVKGPSLSPGYYGHTAPIVDTDGYFHTGDLFQRDKNGIFSFCDRYKDLIKYYNTHIYPSEIEHVMNRHPMVADCAAIGVYQPESAAEFPRVYVILVNNECNSQVMVEELQAYSDSKLPEKKRVRAGIVIVDSFPRTSSGKIQRLLLRQAANNAVSVVHSLVVLK